MSLSSLKTLLDTTGYPVAYRYFPDDDLTVNPPYITYVFRESDNFAADNIAFDKHGIIEVSLWTGSEKNLTAEAKVEDALDGDDIFYEVEEVYYEDEKMYEMLYTFEI